MYFNSFNLYLEYVDENLITQTSTAIALNANNRSDQIRTVTILLAKSSERYRLQSNSFTSLNLMIEQLVYRLKRHFSNKSDFSINYNSSLPTNELLGYINEHFNARQKVIHLQVIRYKCKRCLTKNY